MKKTILLIIFLLLVSISFAYLPDPERGDWAQCLQDRGMIFNLYDNFYIQDLGVSFIFTYTMYDAHSSFYRKDRDDDTNALFYEVREQKYYYGRYQIDSCEDLYITKFPYTIHDCWVICDADDGGVTFFSQKKFNSAGKPFTSIVYHSMPYTCNYDETEGEKTIEVGCTLVMNNYWANNFISIYKGDDNWESHPTPADLHYNESHIVNKCEILPVGCASYEERDCSLCSYNEPYDDSCCIWTTKNSCPGYEGEWRDWGVSYNVCSNVIVDSYSFTFNLNGDNNEMTPEGGAQQDPTDPYEGGEPGGDTGGGIDDSEIGKQIDYNLELGIDAKKVTAIWNLIFIIQIVFSFILIAFYIFELAVTIYVFTVWIPGIFKGMVKILRKVGGV